MSTRYAEPFYFDHGTQFFTARTVQFKDFIQPFLSAGDIQEWQGKLITFEAGKKTTKRMWFEPHYVGAPNMNSFCKKLGSGLSLKLNIEVAPLVRSGDKWQLYDKTGTGLGEFDLVISTAPPVQTIDLFSEYLPQDAALYSAKMLGCYAVMIGFRKPWEHKWIAANVLNNPINWIAVNSSKPGRDNRLTSIVAHTTHQWAEENINHDVQEAQNFLCSQINEVSGIDCSKADYVSTHKWRYAALDGTKNSGPYFDKSNGLGAVGDWSAESRIEDVWLVANQFADQIIEDM